MICSYYLFEGTFQIRLCKGTSVQARQLSKFAHLAGCPNSYVVIHHLPPKLRTTRKFMREKWSYLTPTHGQYPTVTENVSNAFSPSPFLRLRDGEIRKDTNPWLQRSQRWRTAPFSRAEESRPISKPPDVCHHHKILFSLLQQPGKKRCGFACFQLRQSSNWEVT